MRGPTCAEWYAAFVDALCTAYDAEQAQDTHHIINTTTTNNKNNTNTDQKSSETAEWIHTMTKNCKLTAAVFDEHDTEWDLKQTLQQVKINQHVISSLKQQRTWVLAKGFENWLNVFKGQGNESRDRLISDFDETMWTYTDITGAGAKWYHCSNFD